MEAKFDYSAFISYEKEDIIWAIEVQNFLEHPQEGPPHPWTSFLFMTNDGKHCISRCFYGDKYTLFDIKGNIIKRGVQYDEYIKEHPNDILSEFVFSEKFEYDSEQSYSQINVLTAQRILTDGKFP